jgi:hypothetical protein
MPTLRSYIFLDRLQPQLMCLLGSTARGYLPRHNDAALVIEVAPGMDIEWLTDVALKHADVKPGNLVVERQFGYLEFHSKYAASVQSAGAAVLEAIGATPASAVKPTSSRAATPPKDTDRPEMESRALTGPPPAPSNAVIPIDPIPVNSPSRCGRGAFRSRNRRSRWDYCGSIYWRAGHSVDSAYLPHRRGGRR